MPGNVLASTLLMGWPLIVVLLFTVLPRSRAVVWAFVIGWTLLPNATIPVPGLPDYTKATATSLGILAGTALFHSTHLFAFRLRAIDLPIALFCLCPLASSLTNGLGAYDGISAVIESGADWGLPYWIGRLHFTSRADLRELAVGVVGGALIYVPLCLYEIRFSPQLSAMIYEIEPDRFGQHARGSTWRPIVFMTHGLMVGMWMAAGTLLAYWLSRSGQPSVFGVPTSACCALLAATTVLCKSYGAIVLLLVGCATLAWSHRTGRTGLLLIVLAVAPTYLFVRSQGLGKEPILDAVASVFEADRLQSLQYRLDMEDLLVERAWERATFGWGRWGRSHVYDENGRDITVTDGLWIIVFGERGWVGLVALAAMFSLPACHLARSGRRRSWRNPAVAPFAGLCVLSSIYMIDNLLNAMINPVYLVALGATTAVRMRSIHTLPDTAPAPQRPDSRGSGPENDDWIVILPE